MATGWEDMILLMRTHGFGMNHLNLLRTLFGTQVTYVQSNLTILPLNLRRTKLSLSSLHVVVSLCWWSL